MARRVASESASRRPRRWSRVLRAAALALAVAGCTGEVDRPPPGGIAIAFEDIEAPDAFFRQGAARVEDADSTPGLWAAVGGLPRPERGRLRRLGASATPVTVALFRSGGGTIRLSVDAGALIGLDPGDTAEVSITALRREPRLIEP